MSHLSVSFITTLFLSLWSISCASKNESLDKSNSWNHTDTKHQFDFGPGMSLNTKLVIETSLRPSHQIISNVFIEILTAKLNFSNVTLKVNDVSSIDKTMRSFDSNGASPDAMINLEVLVPPDFSSQYLSRNSDIIDAGVLGPTIFPGIFMPRSVVDDLWRTKKITMNYWRFLRNKTYASIFHTPPSGSSHITNPCSSYNNCARLLFFKNDETYVKPISRYINESRLLINPYVVNDSSNVNLMLNTTTMSSKFPLLFSIHPNPMTLQHKWVQVVIPCDVLNYSSNSCACFQKRQIRKWVWKRFANRNPYVFKIIQRMHITQEDYEAILQKVQINKNYSGKELGSLYQRIAREWVDQNANVWRKWIPSDTRHEFVIAGLFSTNGTRIIEKSVIPIVHHMIKKLNEQDHRFLLKLEAYPVSSDNIGTVLYSYNQIIHKCVSSRHVIGIMAAIFSEMVVPIAELNNHYKIPIISPTVESLNKRNGKDFPYLFRVMQDHSDLPKVLKAICKRLHWKRLALFRQNDLLMKPQSLSPLEIIHDFELEESKLHYLRSDLRQALIAAEEKNARIFFVDYQEKGTAMIHCMAAKLKMTPKRGYVWFLNSLFLQQVMPYNDYIRMLKEEGCTQSEIMEIMSTFFTLKPYTHSTFFENDQWHELLTQMLKLNVTFNNKYYPFISDVLQIYHMAMGSLLDDYGIEFITGYLSERNKLKAYLEVIAKTDFTGISGVVKFSNNVRLPTEWGMFQFIAQEHTPKPFMMINVILTNVSNEIYETKKFFIVKQPFPNQKLPKDGSVCDWNFLDYNCKVSRNLSIGLIIGAVLLAVILVGGCIFLCMRCYIRKMKDRYAQPFAELFQALSDYEIPRSALHLQYPLGEGAFGTVYYGEMKNVDSWTGVAAKVLRDGATSQERREFLCEALKMRKFRHVNVMTIIGVVLADPLYVNVMEFMLFGDLRKFLLPRHHLAKTEPDAQDIRPSTLTCMALDIARGLEYLQHNKLVHRDLACRNCLVDKEYRVKIGDFGMTREIDDKKAYYRFEHPGILPVRWMAPESIQSGIFNFNTDVWSYGVVLYEIVTFGNQPYRGRTNEEVIDSMKRCTDSLINYLANPEVRIPQLFHLMRLCWSHRPEERPQISYLIGQLEVNPECVKPCLDEAPPDPGDNGRRGQGLDRMSSVFVGDPPTARGFRGVGVSSGIASAAGGNSFSRIISGGSRSSCDRTRFASGNRVDTDLRHCDSLGRVNNLTNSIASRLGFLKDSSTSKWHSGGGGGSKAYRHTCSQEFLAFSRHHSGDQEISTVSDPHAYQVDYDPLSFVTVHSLAANAVTIAGYRDISRQRCSFSGGQRDEDDLDTDQQTLLNTGRA